MVTTMSKLLQNPSGKYSAYFARRDITIKNLNDRFLELYKDNKDFEHEIYRDGKDYIFFFKIPSEKYPKIVYDVVLQFIPNTDQSSADMTLNNYSVNLFSNAPNFLFTYAYVYNQEGIIIDFLSNKISKKALNEPPNVRNPIQSYGFEKSVYFALLYIKFNRLHNKSVLNSKTKPFKKNNLTKAILSTDEKLVQYNRAKKNDAEQKKLKKSQKKIAKPSEKGYNKKVSPTSNNLKNNVQRTTKQKQSDTKNQQTATKKASTKRNMKRDMTRKKK